MKTMIQPVAAPLLRSFTFAPVFALVAGMALANPMLCEEAARKASQETGVSLALLRAIMLTESGRDTGNGRGPWPWTVQSQGKGEWFETPEQAIARTRDLLDRGVTNIDLGCFQINLHWHSHAFPALEAMLDPEANARYAAEYLLELYAQTGDWRTATGAYHSRDATRAETYLDRLVALHNESARPEPAVAPLSEDTVPDEPVGPLLRMGEPIIVLGSLSRPLIEGFR